MLHIQRIYIVINITDSSYCTVYITHVERSLLVAVTVADQCTTILPSGLYPNNIYLVY